MKIIIAILALLSSITLLAQKDSTVLVDNQYLNCVASQSESYYRGTTEYVATTFTYYPKGIDIFIIMVPTIKFYPKLYEEYVKTGYTLDYIEMMYNTDMFIFNRELPVAPNTETLLWKGVSKGSTFTITILHPVELSIYDVFYPLRPHKGAGATNNLSRQYEFKGNNITLFLPDIETASQAL